MTKQVNHSIRLPEPMLKRLKLRAALHQRSFNGELIYMLNKQFELSEASDIAVANALPPDPPLSGR